MAKKSLKILLILLLLMGVALPVLAQREPKEKIEKERVEFKNLIMGNPNYFGNVLDEAIAATYEPVYLMQNNTKYEEIRCVGLYPEYSLLEAVIEVKLPYGYKGPLCKEGSTEYVAFYVDYNDSAGFVSVGAPAEVNVHDLSFVNGAHLFYAVRKPFIAQKYLKCDTPQIVRVRAILSWEELPSGPNYVPAWGNVVDAWAQIRPKKMPSELVKYLPEMEVMALPIPIPSPKYIIMGDKKEIKELIDRSIAAEERIKKEGEVEQERFEFKNLIMKNPNYFGSITESTNKNEIMQAVYKLPPKTIEYLLPKLTIDPDMLIPVKTWLLKTKYEELRCVGLYPEDDLLEAVLEVKLPYGFNGDLCTLGSKEYVAFYIDWGDSSGYQHVATPTVGVHDIPDVNDKHLFYAVKAEIPNIESKLKACTIENIVKVKAVLSWNVDPTPFGHTYTPTWGNVLTRHIQIRPKDGDSVKCAIDIVNEIHVGEITQSGIAKGLAIKENASGNFVPETYDRPFGDTIACWGTINVSGAAYYRFRYREDNGTTWHDINDPRKTREPNIFAPNYPVKTRTPDGNGWFSKNDYDIDVSNYPLAALVHWNSAGKNGKYLVRLELADAGKTPIPGQTYDVFIRLDNKWPELLEFGGDPTHPAPSLPTTGVAVKDTVDLYKKCDTFIADETIRIFGNFKDDYFLKYRLTVFGGNIEASGEVVDISVLGDGKGRYDSGIAGVGDKGITGAFNGGLGVEIGTLDLCTVSQTGGKVKCAYGIELAIWDRAIRGYVSGYVFNTRHHWKHAFVTFDWDPTGCP